MADKRMFAKSIVLSDAFLDMPLSTRCLYFTLGMLADDDGFVSAPKSIMRQCGASQDDLNILIAKRYVLTFDSGILVIKHWRINNYLRSDRYRETTYVEEKSTLMLDEKGAYTEAGILPAAGVGIPLGIPSIGKDSIGKDSKEEGEKDTPDDLLCFTGVLLEATKDWFKYKQEKRQTYKETGRKNLISQIKNNAEIYGNEAVAKVIKDSMASNYQGIVFDRLSEKNSATRSQQRQYEYSAGSREGSL